MPLSRRQIYIRRRVVVGVTASVVLATAFYLPVTLLAPLSPASAQVVAVTPTVEPAAKLAWPTQGASAIGAIGYPGILAANGSTDALPIASITKVITALIVLEEKPLEVGEAGPSISFTNKDVQLYRSYLALNGKVESVRNGMKLTEHEVLELTLVASANNYTASLVNWAFGSEAAFLPVAQAWLAKNGLAATTLMDCTGMSPQNTSTVGDLLSLGKLALAQPIVSAIVATDAVEIPSLGRIANTNELLFKDGVHGIKTGTLDEAGSCLLFTADYLIGSTAVTVVGVILGGVDHPSVSADTLALLASAKSAFHEVKLASKGEVFAKYQTDWNTTVNAIATHDSSLLVWADTPISLLVKAKDVTLDKAGTDIGSIDFAIGSESVSVPLELATAIEDPGPLWRVTHPFELF